MESHCMDFQKGQYVFYKGQYPQGLYQLVAGEGLCIQSIGEGCVLLTYIHGKEDWFGKEEILDASKWNYSFMALSPVKMIFLSVQEAKKYLNKEVLYASE